MTYTPVQHVARNTRGRDYVVGDIHGYAERLEQLLGRVGFDEARDRLFAVGDFIDRGPDSAGALSLVDQPWLYAVRGNHEQMMIDGLSVKGKPRWGGGHALWQTNGGTWSLRQSAQTMSALRERALALPIALTLDCGDGTTAGLVHAGVPDNDWSRLDGLAERKNDALIDAALWSRDAAYRVQERASGTDSEALIVAGIDRVYHGHTPMPHPVAAANVRWLDTGVFLAEGGLSLTAIDDDTVWTMRSADDHVETGWVRC